MGENGELLELRKIWRTVEPAGTVRVIPASVAFEKLLQGGDLDRTKGPFEVKINKIRLGYYEDPNNVPQEYIEPVWFFQGHQGSAPYQSNMTFFVYARQFADFNQTVESADEGNPVPVHFYKTLENPAGDYPGFPQVSLKYVKTHKPVR